MGSQCTRMKIQALYLPAPCKILQRLGPPCALLQPTSVLLGRTATGLGNALNIGQEEGSVKNELCVCPTPSERAE